MRICRLEDPFRLAISRLEMALREGRHLKASALAGADHRIIPFLVSYLAYTPGEGRVQDCAALAIFRLIPELDEAGRRMLGQALGRFQLSPAMLRGLRENDRRYAALSRLISLWQCQSGHSISGPEDSG